MCTSLYYLIATVDRFTASSNRWVIQTLEYWRLFLMILYAHHVDSLWFHPISMMLYPEKTAYSPCFLFQPQ